jgi:hypothetical protein
VTSRKEDAVRDEEGDRSSVSVDKSVLEEDLGRCMIAEMDEKTSQGEHDSEDPE